MTEKSGTASETGTTDDPALTGLNPDVFGFYAELEQHQSKEWWLANKTRYEQNVRAPIEQLLEAVGGEFGPLKIFRPYKDQRFSADKRPYKDHLGLSSTDPAASTFYLQVSQQGLMFAGGLYQPSREQLLRFREIVDDNRLVGDLEATLDEVGESGMTLMTAGSLTTAPRGFSVEHPKIDLLRAKRLAISVDHQPAGWMYGPEMVSRLRSAWRIVAVWNDWLADNLPTAVEVAR